jgi:hypothetical protein
MRIPPAAIWVQADVVPAAAEALIAQEKTVCRSGEAAARLKQLGDFRQDADDGLASQGLLCGFGFHP